MPVGARLHVTDLRLIQVVNWLIHDEWFELDHVTFDETAGVLTIPYELQDRSVEETIERTWRGKKRAMVPYLRAFLRIGTATDWEVEDTERVGTYDFNGLRYDEARKRMEVLTNIPLELSAAVSGVDVTVEITDEEVGLGPP